jgi:tape measure domain-containing protein
MATVGTAFVQIVPSFKGGVGAIQSQLDGEATTAGTSAGTKFGSSFSSAGSSQLQKLGGIAKWGGVALAGLGVLGVKAGLETAASMENANIAFTTMLGSSQKAGAFIKDLGAFAAKTPFEFPELQTAASSLISAGIKAKNVIPIMTTLGDVTSGMGTGSEGIQRATVALQQMNAAGRITAEDLNQLRDAGIPVYDLLAKATGKTKAEVVKLAQSGKLGKKELDQMMNALATGKGLERFKGLMAKQSKSLGGIWSTFKDNLNMSLAKALAPSLPGLKDGLSAVAKALPGLIKGFVSLVTPMFQLGKWIVENKPVLIGLAAGILTALVPAMVAAAIATWAFTVALLANPLTWIVIGIALLVAAIVLLVQHWDLVKKKTIQIWNAIKRFLADVWLGFKAMAVKIWNGIKTAISKAWDGIKSGVSAGAKAVLKFAVALAEGILNAYLFLPRKMLELGKAIALGLRDGIAGAWHWVTDKVEALIAKIPLAIRKLLHIASPSRVMMELGGFISEGLAIGIDSGRSDVAASLRGLTGRAATIDGSVGRPVGANSDRPIRMADGTLFGWVRTIANGEAELVLNNQAFKVGVA